MKKDQLNTQLSKLLKRLGKNIKNARKRKGLTQENMDTPPNPIPYKYYQSIEAGKANITIETLLKIANKIDTDPKDLF